MPRQFTSTTTDYEEPVFGEKSQEYREVMKSGTNSDIKENYYDKKSVTQHSKETPSESTSSGSECEVYCFDEKPSLHLSCSEETLSDSSSLGSNSEVSFFDDDASLQVSCGEVTPDDRTNTTRDCKVSVFDEDSEKQDNYGEEVLNDSSKSTMFFKEYTNTEVSSKTDELHVEMTSTYAPASVSYDDACMFGDHSPKTINRYGDALANLSWLNIDGGEYIKGKESSKHLEGMMSDFGWEIIDWVDSCSGRNSWKSHKYLFEEIYINLEPLREVWKIKQMMVGDLRYEKIHLHYFRDFKLDSLKVLLGVNETLPVHEILSRLFSGCFTAQRFLESVKETTKNLALKQMVEDLERYFTQILFVLRHAMKTLGLTVPGRESALPRVHFEKFKKLFQMYVRENPYFDILSEHERMVINFELIRETETAVDRMRRVIGILIKRAGNGFC